MRHRIKWDGRVMQVDCLQREPLQIRITEEDKERVLAHSTTLHQTQGRIALGTQYVPYFVTAAARGIWVTLAGHTFFFEKTEAASAGEAGQGSQFETPMPGKVIAVPVTAGEDVSAGQVLVIMEAMKMEHRIEAPANGSIETLFCEPGQVVPQGFKLLDFKAVIE